MFKVSIIIPIFKVEQYIERCVCSVLNQTYRELEIILIDDCSPDNSMSIAKSFIEQSPLGKDLQFVYLKHERNRGLSAARNTGMDAATGEYVYFLDSDDEITEDCIEALAKPLEEKKYDFVVGNYKNVGHYNFYQPLGFSGGIFGQEQIAQKYLDKEWYPMAVNKLCRLEYLKGKGLCFQEGLIHEDELWSFQLACTATKIYGINKITYFYIIRQNSITTANDANKKERRSYHCMLILKSMYEYQRKHKLYKSVISSLIINFRRVVYSVAMEAGHTLRETYIQIRKCDQRPFMVKWQSYPSLKEKIKNLDDILPVSLGYIYRLLIRKYFAWRNHDKNYPLYF